MVRTSDEVRSSFQLLRDITDSLTTPAVPTIEPTRQELLRAYAQKAGFFAAEGKRINSGCDKRAVPLVRLDAGFRPRVERWNCPLKLFVFRLRPHQLVAQFE